MTKNPDLHPETLAAQALGEICPITGAVVPPLQVATTFARDNDYQQRDGRGYIRDTSPTVEQAAKIVCALEKGEDALMFPSGLSACTAAFHTLNQGDHIVIAETLYHGVTHWAQEFADHYGLSVSQFDATNPDSLNQIIKPGRTKIVWIEMLANPTWVVADIAAIANITHQHNALLGVDATVNTPVLCQPITFGADLVAHAATKYLNGHSDVLAGMLICKNADSQIWQRIRDYRKLAGPMPGARGAYELIRGMKTLHLRVRQQCENALAIATMLDKHPAVEHVHYPGLPDNIHHQVAKRQLKGGFGGMLSILIKGGKYEAVKVATSTQVWKPATSLGGVESLIEHRKTSEGDITNTPENLLRLSVGIEHIDDLINDLEQALAMIE